MLDASDAHNALLVRKNSNGETIVRKRLQDAISSLVPDAEHQIEHLFSLSNSSQFLFSDCVLLVEGKTERKILPHIFQSVKGISLGQAKIALIPLDGVTNLCKSMAILHEMDLPSKAIVDLDYAFSGAISDGLLEQRDPDLLALKIELERMETLCEITLHDSTRLPKNGIQGSASNGYQILAQQSAMKTHIDNIHNKLLPHGIWLWTRGAIEPHLGIKGKTERDWARFLNLVSTKGYESACSNDQKAISLFDWIHPDG